MVKGRLLCPETNQWKVVTNTRLFFSEIPSMEREALLDLNITSVILRRIHTYSSAGSAATWARLGAGEAAGRQQLEWKRPEQAGGGGIKDLSFQRKIQHQRGQSKVTDAVKYQTAMLESRQMTGKRIWVKSTKSSGNDTEIKVLRKFAWRKAENWYTFVDFPFKTE